MSECYLITMLLKPDRDLPPGSIGDAIPIFRFISTADEGRANYHAGCILDSFADYYGLEFDYRVEPIPVIHAGILEASTLKEVERAALETDI